MCRNQLLLLFTVGAQYTQSTQIVKEMPLFKRACLRHDEDMKNYPDVKLNVFSNYSRKACLLECQALQLFKECGCLPYYFPDFSTVWKQDTSCDYAGLLCLSRVAGINLVKRHVMSYSYNTP